MMPQFDYLLSIEALMFLEKQFYPSFSYLTGKVQLSPGMSNEIFIRTTCAFK